MSKNSHPLHKNAPHYLTKYRAYVKIGCELFLYMRTHERNKMFNGFNRFKGRVRLQAIIASVLLGIGLAVASLAVSMLILKLSGKDAQLVHYLVCGAMAPVLSPILYFVFMPSDVRLAKRLDSCYTLDEKVSTMIELREDASGFATLQREDANERLGNQPVKMIKSKQLVAGLLVFFISLGCFAGAWMLPIRADGGETPIDEFDKQWLITAIGELITIVENAYINDNLRANTLTELNSLLDFVKESSYLSEMKAKAITTVIAINTSLNKANSAEAISVAFSQSANPGIVNLATALGALSGSGSKTALEELGDSLNGANTSDKNFAADEIDSYLASSGVRSDDSVYALLKGLVSVLKDGSADVFGEFSSAGSRISSEVVIQSVNRSTMNMVINKLCNLFGITEDDLITADPDTDIDLRDPSDDGVPPDDTQGKEPENNLGAGGLGTGDVIYGSDDLVFDPDTNTYRPYGEILNEYFAKANEQITDGKVSDEISDAAEEYFGTLFGGSAEN